MSPGHLGALGLGIETSCDETSVAVVRAGREIRSNVVYSQIEEHAPFLGVVPEIASRAHVEKINGVYAEALARAGVAATELDYVAVSSRPGLLGSLMVGAQLARSLALVHDLPIVACDHVEAHFYAVALENQLPPYPFLGLLLSGGNSSIYVVRGIGQLELLVDTRDDALGEAFDKAAAVLGLGYPGGPAVERTASGEDILAAGDRLFPPLLRQLPADAPAFSFSGLKTAVGRARGAASVERICNDFQETAFALVVRMLALAVEKVGVRSIVAAGGVLANGRLRAVLEATAHEQQWLLAYPQSRLLCTDNAAMIAALGHGLFARGDRSPLDFQVSSVR